MKTLRVLAGLSVCVLLLSQNGKPRALITVPNAKSLICLSAAPLDSSLFLLASPNESEDYGGTPTIIRLGVSGQPTIKTLPTLGTCDVGTVPSWSRDGKTVFFESEGGVVSYNLVDDRVESLWSGKTRGLALSRNGEYLAFWNLSYHDRDHLTLVLFDLKTKREKQTWVIPNIYGGDEVGFHLAFGADDRFIYARTFDQEVSSPLERFIIGSDTREMVSPNVTGAVSGDGAVYFVTEKLAKDTLVYTLMAVSDSVSRPEQLKTDLPCRGLTLSGSHRWIVCDDDGISGEAKLLFDIKKGAFVSPGSNHGNLAVMPSGDLVYSLGGSLLAGNPIR